MARKDSNQLNFMESAICGSVLPVLVRTYTYTHTMRVRVCLAISSCSYCWEKIAIILSLAHIRAATSYGRLLSQMGFKSHACPQGNCMDCREKAYLTASSAHACMPLNGNQKNDCSNFRLNLGLSKYYLIFMQRYPSFHG